MKLVFKVFSTLLILLCTSLCSYAEAGDFIVRFTEGFIPENFKTVISRENGVYLFEDERDFNSYPEYIESVEKDGTVCLEENNIPVLLAVQDEYYSEQWNMELVEAEYAWNLETYGNDIRVAVIDSGCYPHPDLTDNLIAGRSYISAEPTTVDGNGHGTHVCGIIAAKQDEVGITGIAPKAKIVPLKAFDTDGSSSYSYLSSAIYDAVDVFDCKIINMSWRIGSNNSAVHEAIKYAAEKGVILIAAAGNDGNSTMYYPAGYEEVISVASVERNKEQSTFSQRNSSVDIAAPGGYTLSTYKDGEYYFLQGTSQAAPIVAGIAAIALSADYSITREEFKKIIIDTAEDLGDEGYDINYGYGLVNVTDMMDEIVEKKECYVSPINFSGDEQYVYCKNNTPEEVRVGKFDVYYDKERLKHVNVCYEILAPNVEKKIILTTNGDKYFMWNMKNFTPLRK